MKTLVLLFAGLLLAAAHVFAGNGNLLVDGSIGVGTTTEPTAKIEVKGEIKLGSTGLACTSVSSGAIRYNSTANAIEFCNGTSWSALSGGASNSTTPTTPTTPTDKIPPVSTASVPSGSYTTQQVVTLTANESATIYYSTTGVTPTTNSAVYTAPIVLPSTTTLMYFAKDLAGNVETVKTANYIIGAANVNDAGSFIQSSAGTYTHTFTSNATVSVNYLIGAAGGTWGFTDGGGTEGGGYGGVSSIAYSSVIKATANGGGGGIGLCDSGRCGVVGSATNTIGGANSNGVCPDRWSAAGGGKIAGGSFTVVTGQTITVVVGAGGGAGGDGADGLDGSVSLSWK